MKAVETPSAMTLRPPPINHHKSFDGDTISEKHIVPQNKTHTAQMNVVQYSFADLQMATDRFTDEKLIGEGFIGSVYRAHFDNGEVISLS